MSQVCGQCLNVLEVQTGKYLCSKLLKTVHFVPIQEALALASRPSLTVKKAAALQQNQRPLLKLEDRRRKRMQAVLKVKRVWR